MPPSIKEWPPKGRLAHFVSETADRLDLSAITSEMGLTSSRRMERLVVEDVALLMLADDPIATVGHGYKLVG